MEAFFISAVSAILINICSARLSSYSGSSYGSLGTSIVAAIVIPIVVGIIICVALIVCCTAKCAQRQRMGVLPLSTQMILAQQEYQYAPPGFKQPPPYGQPPPYEQPPPYSAPAAPMEPTTV